MSKSTLAEALTKAVQAAEILRSDLLEAHRISCEVDPVAGIILLDQLEALAKVQQRLGQLEGTFQREG